MSETNNGDESPSSRVGDNIGQPNQAELNSKVTITCWSESQASCQHCNEAVCKCKVAKTQAPNCHVFVLKGSNLIHVSPIMINS